MPLRQQESRAGRLAHRNEEKLIMEFVNESTWAATRALWTTPAAEEAGWPAKRIIHAGILRLPEPCRLQRVGVRAVPKSYYKCGGVRVRDWPSSIAVHAWRGEAWEPVLRHVDLPDPGEGVHWFDLDNLERASLLIEARGCSVDKGWTTWNLASGGLLVEGEAPPLYWPADSVLDIGDVNLRRCPRGVRARSLPGEIRYQTDSLEVGFHLGRPGFSYLALDDEAQGRTGVNLIHHVSLSTFTGYESPITKLVDNQLQGLRLHPVGMAPQSSLLWFEGKGETSVRGNVVTYTMAFPAVGQRYVLRWEVLPDRLLFTAERRGQRALRCWHSGIWHTCLNSCAAVCTVLGNITREGEVGLMRPPVLIHAPGHGTLRLGPAQPTVLCRSDSFRPAGTNAFELKLGEEAQPLGDYLLLPGRHRAEIAFAVHPFKCRVRKGTPVAVRRALNRCAVTGMTYRADTATLSNNGNSIHAVICADCWSAETTRIGPLIPELDANDLLRDSLDRHLDGGPSYGSGPVNVNGDVHYMEDEYLHTGAALLRAIADYLHATGAADWLNRHAAAIAGELARMRARDLDGDGLIESNYRRGVSGEHHWSTQWYDQLSFGWKDAFSNAVLYPALRLLAADLPRLGRADLADGLEAWAGTMKTNYLKTFLNPETGLIAGWKCAEGKLHDYAFLYVAGAAVDGGLVDGKPARAIITRLWKGLRKQRLDHRMGLPGNLEPIPYADMTTLLMRPGVFENGALTHSQARHFIGAMYKVGLVREADELIELLCSSLADGHAFGGQGSGIEWRRRDGAYSGYEGILSDQFGILAVAMDRYVERGRGPAFIHAKAERLVGRNRGRKTRVPHREDRCL